ncbi:MAG: hypothetical protein P9M14_14460 [Candidatus Alcyoniella australis]|nr:hypothetical protein [Candidatus Alcyoniella australis]
MNERAKRSLFYLALLGLPLLALLLAYSLSAEPQWITVNYQRLDSTPLNTALVGTRIVVVADLHSYGFRTPELNVLRTVEELDADWVLVPGDILPRIDADHDAVDVLHSLHARNGVIASYGDSDVFFERELSGQNLLRTPTTLLNDRVQVLVDSYQYIQGPGGPVLIAGLDGIYPPEPTRFLDSLPRDAPVILLAHYPEVFDAAAQRGIELTVSGDTHGGQVELPHFLLHLIFGPAKTKYRQGLFSKGESLLYVNQGIGMSVLPMRFACRPEITVFDF